LRIRVPKPAEVAKKQQKIENQEELKRLSFLENFIGVIRTVRQNSRDQA